MKIKYAFANGEISVIDVSDDLGEILMDFDRLEHNNDQTEHRRHASLWAMDYEGEFFVDQRADVISAIERDFAVNEVHEAMTILLPRQKQLLREVFFEERTIISIANEEGVSEAAIRNRLKKIYEQMKKIMN